MLSRPRAPYPVIRAICQPFDCPSLRTPAIRRAGRAPIGPDAVTAKGGPRVRSSAGLAGGQTLAKGSEAHLITFARAVVVTCAVLTVTTPLHATAAEAPERWYGRSRVESGERVYAAHCAVCHGAQGEAAPDWRQREPDGTFPPPPLNGTAHTWHHPFEVLARQIKFGAPGGAGKMPPFQGKLTDEEIINVLAWVQSLWPDEIYAQWWAIQQRSSQ